MRKIIRINLEAPRNKTHVELDENLIRYLWKYRAEEFNRIHPLFNIYKSLYLEDVSQFYVICKGEISAEEKEKRQAASQMGYVR